MHFEPGLWSPSNFGMAGAKNFRWWRQSLKFGFRFHRHSLWGKGVVQMIQWFSVFNGPNNSGAGAKKLLDVQSVQELFMPRSHAASVAHRVFVHESILSNTRSTFARGRAQQEARLHGDEHSKKPLKPDLICRGVPRGHNAPGLEPLRGAEKSPQSCKYFLDYSTSAPERA